MVEGGNGPTAKDQTTLDAEFAAAMGLKPEEYVQLPESFKKDPRRIIEQSLKLQRMLIKRKSEQLLAVYQGIEGFTAVLNWARTLTGPQWLDLMHQIASTGNSVQTRFFDLIGEMAGLTKKSELPEDQHQAEVDPGDLELSLSTKTGV